MLSTTRASSQISRSPLALVAGRRTDARYMREQQLRIAPESPSDTF
jgi:hypothetical protein